MKRLADNPLTRVHDALWSRLLAHPGIAARVKPRNRIAFTAGEAADPRRNNAQVADTPEVTILPAGVESTRMTSDSHRVVARFAIAVRTGKINIDSVLLPLTWDVLCAYESVDRDSLGVDEVTGVEARAVTFAIAERGSGSPEMQWTSIGEVIVTMSISRASMRGEAD